MAVFKYLNPNYVEGGSEPKWIKIPLTGSAVITPVQSTGQSEVDIMSQKAVTDALNTKQNTLVSGTNIKTINGQTLLGNGDVDMSEFATQEDVADINQTIDSLGDTYATKDDLSGYLPLNGGGIIDTSNYELDLTGNGLEIMSTSTGSNAKYSIGGIQITERQEDGDGVSTISIETNYVKGGSLNIEGTEYKKEGVTISNKTTSDLLNAGGSTTSISDITTQVQAAIVDSAPETLDTLNELAAALGDDPNFATTVTNKIAAKQDKLVSGTNIKTINGQSLVGTGNITTVGRRNGVGETFNSSTNVATGANSHAEGANTNASGNNSHTEGSFTQAKNSYEHAEGHYNLSHQDGTHAGTTRHSVGMGNSDEDRKNAFEIMADGSAYMMDLGGYDGINYASATSVQDVIKGKQDALVSGNTIKTINGQSLLGSGNISLLSNPVSGTLTVGGTTSNVPTINIKRDDTPHPAVRSIAVNVTTSEVQYDFNNHRNIGTPFRGLIIVNLAQALPSGATATLPIVFTSEGSNPIPLTGYNGAAITVADLKGTGIYLVWHESQTNTLQLVTGI